MKSSLTILRGSVGSPSSLSLIKELQNFGHKIIGTDANPLSSGLYLCEKGYVVPKGNYPKYLQKILQIYDTEKPDLILPSSEDEILTLSQNKRLFDQRNIVLLCPNYDTVLTCNDKIKTNIFFVENNIPTPRIYESKNIEFPSIIKPRFGKGSENVYRLDNSDDLEFYQKKIKEPIIQEFISGEEYSVDILSDFESNAISIVPRIRIQTESGISIKSKTVNEQTIIKYCKEISKKIKLIGPSCIQLIKSNNLIKFIEINPRFGGGSILSIKSDKTIIPNLIRLTKNEPLLPNIGFDEEMVLLRYYDDVLIHQDKLLDKL